MNLLEEILEYKDIQHHYEVELIELNDMENISSSDELSERNREMNGYRKNIISLDEKIDDLYLQLGSDKLFDELLRAIELGGKKELLKVANRQLNDMRITKGRFNYEDK